MRYVIFVLAMLLLTACGGGIDPPAAVPANFTVVRGDRVALAIPDEAWYAMQPTPADFHAVADRVRAGNPFLAQRIDEMADDIRDDTLRLAAYYEDGYTSLNVTAENVPIFESVESHAAANRDGLEEVGYTILDTDMVTLNSRKTARTEAEIRIFTDDGTPMTITLLQYTVIAGGKAYSISFGTPRFQYAEFEPLFEQIANTFYTVE